MKLAGKPTFKNTTPLDSEVGAVDLVHTFVAENRKETVIMDKPIQNGLAILDYSKLIMVKFYYEYLVPKFGQRMQLCYGDTDSKILHIYSDDLDAEIYPDLEEHFDTSNYPEEHYFPKINKKVLGKFKNESPLHAIEEVVCLRPKQYALKYSNGKTTLKSKGLSKQSMKEITFEDYLSVLETQQPICTTMRGIKSHNHVVYTEEFTKKALDGYDEKRIILENNIDTVPYGYEQSS